jgi:hypothetical protein
MISPSDSAALPYTVTLSSAYASGEISPSEYYGTRHVVALEDSAKKVFYRAHWSDVRVGDIVLIAVREGAIVEAVVEEAVEFTAHSGRDLVSVAYRDAGRLFKGFRWPDATVYVRSRF